jgi:hypothetical protein
LFGSEEKIIVVFVVKHTNLILEGKEKGES